jgi:hypothetical protein
MIDKYIIFLIFGFPNEDKGNRAMPLIFNFFNGFWHIIIILTNIKFFDLEI